MAKVLIVFEGGMPTFVASDIPDLQVAFVDWDKNADYEHGVEVNFDTHVLHHANGKLHELYEPPSNSGDKYVAKQLKKHNF